MLFAYVGNTCPDIYKYGDKLAVGTDFREKEDMDKCINKSEAIQNGDIIGNICTDLWWCSMADIEVYKKILANHYKADLTEDMIKELYANTIDIKPGGYKCTYHKINESDNQDYVELYISLEWLRNS